jgi:hypothetical protein
MAGGNTPINRIAGASQSRIIKTGETFEGAVSSFIPREDTVIETLREKVILNQEETEVNVIGDDIVTVVGATTLFTGTGQNIDGETLHAGEIYVPRFGCFTTIRPTSGSVVAYLLLSTKDLNKKINDNI